MGLVTILDTQPVLAEQLARHLRAADLTVRAERYAPGQGVRFDASSVALVLGPGLDQEAALTIAEMLNASSATPVVLISAEVSLSLMKAAMRVGVRDVCSAKEASEDLAAAVVAAVRAALPASATKGKGRVVTVLGMKGGVGKSIVSSNLAVGLASYGKRTVLLDLDLQFGDAAIMLQLKPERTIYDAMQAYDRLDAEMLAGFLVSHPSGLKALLAPVAPEEAESVTGVRLGRIIELLRQIADVVVIDTPPALNDVVLTALEESDEVYAVSGLEVPSVKSIRVALQKLKQLGFDPARTRLIVNRADSKVGLDPSEVAKATGCVIAAEVPSDRLVPSSVNRGVPIVMDKPKSAVARSLLLLARDVASRCPGGRHSADSKRRGASADVA